MAFRGPPRRPLFRGPRSGAQNSRPRPPFGNRGVGDLMPGPPPPVLPQPMMSGTLPLMSRPPPLFKGPLAPMQRPALGSPPAPARPPPPLLHERPQFHQGPQAGGPSRPPMPPKGGHHLPPPPHTGVAPPMPGPPQPPISGPPQNHFCSPHNPPPAGCPNFPPQHDRLPHPHQNNRQHLPNGPSGPPSQPGPYRIPGPSGSGSLPITNMVQNIRGLPRYGSDTGQDGRQSEWACQPTTPMPPVPSPGNVCQVPTRIPPPPPLSGSSNSGFSPRFTPLPLYQSHSQAKAQPTIGPHGSVSSLRYPYFGQPPNGNEGYQGNQGNQLSLERQSVESDTNYSRTIPTRDLPRDSEYNLREGKQLEFHDNTGLSVDTTRRDQDRSCSRAGETSDGEPRSIIGSSEHCGSRGGTSADSGKNLQRLPHRRSHSSDHRSRIEADGRRRESSLHHEVGRRQDRRRDRRKDKRRERRSSSHSRDTRDRDSNRRSSLHLSHSDRRRHPKDAPKTRRDHRHKDEQSKSHSRRRSHKQEDTSSGSGKGDRREGDRSDKHLDGRSPALRSSVRSSPDKRRRTDHQRDRAKSRSTKKEESLSAPALATGGGDAMLEDIPPSPPSWEDMSAESRYQVLSQLLDGRVTHSEGDDTSAVAGECVTTLDDGELATEEHAVPVPAWIRCAPADLYFRRDRETNCMVATKKMEDLEDRFESDLIMRAANVRATKPPYEKPVRPNAALTKHKHPGHHRSANCAESSSCSSNDSDDSDIDDEVATCWMQELNRKQHHPERLHAELWFNEPGEPILKCCLNSNNSNKLYHYRVTMSPHTNFLTKNPTLIEYDSHEYIFEGFSLLSHYKLDNIPVCKVIRFNIEYTIHWFEEDVPENFSLRSINLFTDYLFYELLELVDLDWKPKEDSCSRFHIMPRFARDLPDNGKEILSMNEVLLYLLRSAQPLIDEEELLELLKFEKHEWQSWVDKVRGMIVTFPGMRPSSIRIDQLDREQQKESTVTYPMIIHFGIRPAQLSYAGDPIYQKLWKQYVKFKHLLANKPKITLEDKNKLERKEEQLQEMRMKSSMKREVTVELSAQGFIKTGIKSDMCQHAMLLPVLIVHLRFHKCLYVLETTIDYVFNDRLLLQLALTHPSYRVNFGTNPDHARNSLSNCGIRQPEYGDRRIHHVHTRKRGINTLINIMSRLGSKEETPSEINHYERLEFLGDAVVEFVCSIHLYFMFPSLEEGGLATYRAAIVQNQHLAVLAKKLRLHDFMLYAHGPDLCHESDLRHAMANCLEALMGALFLDGGIELADRIFGDVLFDDDKSLLNTWRNLPVHPLQEDEPNGDRHWITSSPALQKLLKFEEVTGTQFTHIRLLARAFTLRNVGYNNLTFGHNQRLEFLGDTVLQLIASEYLFKHFPEHHEGHLSLLRSSLVNNRTQAVVCDDLGMTEYIIHADNRPYDHAGMKHKEKADLLEAFLGGLYVDKDLEYCNVFCDVCFFPRLKQFILNQDWNDPKSQLQQCCLTLRELDGGEPDIPIYKVIASTGPTNTRKYTVAVYFRGERLATGIGHSIQQAEMSAATNALSDRGELFPQLAHQKKFIERKYKRKRRRSKQDNDVKSGDQKDENNK